MRRSEILKNSSAKTTDKSVIFASLRLQWLEIVTQHELNDARASGSRHRLSESGIGNDVDRRCKIDAVEQIEEVRSNCKLMAFGNGESLRDLEVHLSESRAYESASRNVSRTVKDARIQSLELRRQRAGLQSRIRVRIIRLVRIYSVRKPSARSAHVRSLSVGKVEDCERIAVLRRNDAGHRPTAHQFVENQALSFERELIDEVQDEAIAGVEARFAAFRSVESSCKTGRIYREGSTAGLHYERIVGIVDRMAQSVGGLYLTESESLIFKSLGYSKS